MTAAQVPAYSAQFAGEDEVVCIPGGLADLKVCSYVYYQCQRGERRLE
jgi:hypothetical protein